MDMTITGDRFRAANQEQRAAELANPRETIERRTRVIMAETGSDDYRATFMRVAKADPELHRAYLDSNGVKNRFA